MLVAASSSLSDTSLSRVIVVFLAFLAPLVGKDHLGGRGQPAPVDKEDLQDLRQVTADQVSLSAFASVNFLLCPDTQGGRGEPGSEGTIGPGGPPVRLAH